MEGDIIRGEGEGGGVKCRVCSVQYEVYSTLYSVKFTVHSVQ